MMRLLFLHIVLFVSSALNAQDCDPLALMNRPAQQVKLPDIDTRHAFAADLPAARKVVNYIDKIFELAYKPKGVKVERFANYNNSNKYQGENRKINSKVHSSNYGYDIYNYNYYCSNGKFATQGETSLRMYLRINSGLNRIPNDTVPILDGDGSLYVHQPLGFYDLEHWVSNKKLPTPTGNYYTYTYEQAGRRNTVWVITRNGKLPFQYVTRRVFLQKRINISKATIKEFKNQATHPKVMEAYKEIAAYEAVLKKPNDWLNQISIVRREYDKDYYRYVFTTLEATGNPQPQVPVQPDYSYFDKSLPAAAPQYIVITYANSGNNPEAANFKKSIEDNLELFVKLVNSQHNSPAQNNAVMAADVKTTTSKVPEDKTVVQAPSAESIAKNKDPYTFLFEDFQQVSDGGYPPGWITNSALPRPSIHHLEKASGSWLLIPAAKTLSQQNANPLPEKFSIEYDLFFTNTEASHFNYYTLILSADKHNYKQVLNATNQPIISGQSEFRLLINMDKRKEKFWIEHSRDKMSDDGRVQTGKMNFPVTTKDKPVRVSITVNGRSLKAKLNDQIIIDDPQYLPEGIQFKKYAFSVPGSRDGYGIYMSNLNIKSNSPLTKTTAGKTTQPNAEKTKIITKDVPQLEEKVYASKFLKKLDKLPKLIYPKGIVPTIEEESNKAKQSFKTNYTFPAKSPKLTGLSRTPLTEASYKQFIAQLTATAASKMPPADLKSIEAYLKKADQLKNADLAGMAMKLWVKGGSLAALYLFGKALEKNPADLTAANNLSALLINNGYPEKAVTILNFVNKQAAQHPIVLANLANAYYNLGDFATASTFATSCLQKDEDNMEANKIKAFLLIQKATQKGFPDKGDIEQAIVCLKKGLQSRYDQEASKILNQIEEGHRMTRDIHNTNFNEFPLLKAIQLPEMPTSLAEMRSFNVFRIEEQRALTNTAAAIEKKYTAQSDKRSKQSFTMIQSYASAALMLKAASLFTENVLWFPTVKKDINAIFDHHRNEINKTYNARTRNISKKYDDQINKLEGGEKGEEEEEIERLEKAKCAELNTVNQQRLVELAQLTHEYARNMEYAARVYCRDYANWGPLQMIDNRYDTRNTFFLYAQKQYLSEISQILEKYPSLEPCVYGSSDMDTLQAGDGTLKIWEDEWCASMEYKFMLGGVTVESDCYSISISGGEGIVGEIKVTLDENHQSIKEVTIAAGVGVGYGVGPSPASLGVGVSSKQYITLEIGTDGAVKVKDWGNKSDISFQTSFGPVGHEITITEAVSSGTVMGGIVGTSWNL